jgi:hypothetical protein
MRQAACVALIASALAACAQAEVIVLRNPATGEIRECSRTSGASFFPIAQTMMDNSAARSCAAGYQAAGFGRLN